MDTNAPAILHVWRRDLRDDFDVFFAMQDVVDDLVKVDFLGRRERNIYFQSLRQNSSRSVSLRKALFFPQCPVVFQKHWPDPLRPCPRAPGAHCQLSLKIHPALPWSQLTVARQGLGSGALKRSRKCSRGPGVQYKEKRLLLESSERGRWKGPPVPLASSLTQPSSMRSQLHDHSPFLLHSVPLSVSSALSDLPSQSCPMCPTHFPPPPSFLPSCTIKTPILLQCCC